MDDLLAAALGGKRVALLSGLKPGEQQQRTLGIEGSPPGFEAEMEPLAGNAQQVRQQILAAAPAQMRTNLPHQFIPEWRIRSGQQCTATFWDTTHESRPRRTARSLQGKMVEAFNYFVGKRRRKRRPAHET